MLIKLDDEKKTARLMINAEPILDVLMELEKTSK